MISDMQSGSTGPAAPRPIRITRAGIIGTLLLAAVVITCVRLGFWQLSRLDDRREQNAGIASRLNDPPITDVGALADTTGLSYRVLSASGLFDNERYLVLPGRSHRGVPGVHLLVPLRLDGRRDAVLVNRGWVPSADAATIEADSFAIRDTVTVRGLVLPFPGRDQSLAQRPAPRTRDAAFRHVWFTVDEPELRAQFPYPLASAMIQELPGGGAPRYPVRLEPPPLDEGPHLGYAFQWFAFAVIGVIGWFALVLRSRTPPRSAPPSGVSGSASSAGVLALACMFAPAVGHAQLRPLDPLEWRVFDPGVSLVAEVGAGWLHDQSAPLSGTRGTLLEAGRYLVALRSGRIGILVSGTAIWRLAERDTVASPVAFVGPADSGIRQDVGPAMAATALRVSRNAWPLDLVLRFGATIPTTSDESGLDRDRTDFFALVGARYRRGALDLAAENGVGIHGTTRTDLPQSDVWVYAFGAAYRVRALRVAADFVGRQDGHSYVIRGNEDQRELRVGIDAGQTRWLGIRYVRGFADHAPAHGVRVSGGLLLRRLGL